MRNVVVAIATLIYFQINWLVFNKINDNVNTPYMDEIFHIPQARHYCAGNYSEWNDKITTLPGLYYLSSWAFRLIAMEVSLQPADVSTLCTVNNLRLINLVLSAFCFAIIYKILEHFSASKRTTYSIGLGLLNTLSISLFPLSYFFQFLFYTDTGSTLFILFAYLQQLRSNHKLAAFSSAIAILFRQTNVIWLVYFMFQLILTNAETMVRNQEPKMTVTQNTETGAFNLTQKSHKKCSNFFELIIRKPSDEFDLRKFLVKFYREDLRGKMLIYPDLYRAMDMTKPYLLVLMKFLIFIYLNNGIVVGDRSNHKATIHLVQIFYFAVFCAFFSSSTFLFSIKKLKFILGFFKLNFRLVLGIVLPLFCVIVKNFSFEHPFLLADNRHYPFYIWSRFMRRYEAAKYSLTPGYILAFYVVYCNLKEGGKTIGWLLAFFVCVIAALVPQELVEFRYFILAYLLYRVNLGLLTWRQAVFELILNAGVNLATLYVFIYKTFKWNDVPEEQQRFMW